jgi:GNAT superfamily N-acetyltransferase
MEGILGKLGQTWPVKLAESIYGAFVLPGQVASGVLNVPPSQPGMWSDMDEAKSQATQGTMMNRAADLGGLVMGGAYGQAPVGSLGMAGSRFKSIDEFREHFDGQNVRSFIADRPSRNEIQLSDLVVPKEMRGQGVGSGFMRELADLADDLGKRVTLSPAVRDDHVGTTSRSRLVDFYKRFGFVENKGRKKDFAVSDSMYRDPK